MAFFLGIDVGSGYTKAVVCEDTSLRSYSIIPSGGDYRKAALESSENALKKINISMSDISNTIATGYGAAIVDFARQTLSDISCHAIGINYLFPSVRTVIDIGAQYSRAIHLDSEGRIVNFIMNEKCAGGSGKFLQVTARILQMDIKDLGRLSLTSEKPVEFTTACAVFAESEAVSRISEGALPADIVAGIHKAMSSKIIVLATRVGLVPDYAVTGGGAKDIGLVRAIEKELKTNTFVAQEPQITAALGAAIFASSR
ncbi:MAG TPA: acyl-CoA dehydratase activase [Syntrophorhabdaceae bacterium]|nr:acyl-CoA dehydratase activase [Syntrophorhabdaceae bacterium]HOL06359.1 acyl-CoA dehydratase activase [Syntrophorhabdaceae bacterium]HON85561.1 acyl-CoA dehydratase activase [Syntrophorhabdaceae bacterium]HOT42911.1 acyl-CoA dehydratase activase [Syntrophorhabdaceae bacterium]HPC66482.1 acyl-CoA dehydratase activase [Syntrophorhabdaceae bacterium]